MKYYVMWHPTLKWGGPVPVLLPHKRNAVQGSGLSLGRIREMGWRWLSVVIDEPVQPEADWETRRDQIDIEIADLMMERKELERANFQAAWAQENE